MAGSASAKAERALAAQRLATFSIYEKLDGSFEGLELVIRRPEMAGGDWQVYRDSIVGVLEEVIATVGVDLVADLIGEF